VNVRVGRISGEIAGGPARRPSSISARCAVMSSAVRAFAITSQSANASVPAMWSRCQWLRTTVIRLAPRRSTSARIARACGTETWVS
jgi:hypothetical protein